MICTYTAGQCPTFFGCRLSCRSLWWVRNLWDRKAIPLCFNKSRDFSSQAPLVLHHRCVTADNLVICFTLCWIEGYPILSLKAHISQKGHSWEISDGSTQVQCGIELCGEQPRTRFKQDETDSCPTRNTTPRTQCRATRLQEIMWRYIINSMNINMMYIHLAGIHWQQYCRATFTITTLMHILKWHAPENRINEKSTCRLIR